MVRIGANESFSLLGGAKIPSVTRRTLQLKLEP